MKKRLGFVSNSSSSSFVVVSKNSFEIKQTLSMSDGHLILGELGGDDEFGWDFIEYDDFLTKLNWVCLQADYAKNKEYKEMIENVLKDNIEGIDSIEWSLSGYIDHQSIGEGNDDVFESEESLKAFLFSPSSYIKTGNDNV